MSKRNQAKLPADFFDQPKSNLTTTPTTNISATSTTTKATHSKPQPQPLTNSTTPPDDLDLLDQELLEFEKQVRTQPSTVEPPAPQPDKKLETTPTLDPVAAPFTGGESALLDIDLSLSREQEEEETQARIKEKLDRLRLKRAAWAEENEKSKKRQKSEQIEVDSTDDEEVGELDWCSQKI